MNTPNPAPHRRLDRLRRPRDALRHVPTTSSAARRRTRRSRRRCSRPVRVVGVVGDGLPRGAPRRRCASAASTPRGVERADGQDVPLARPLRAGPREPRRRSTRSSTSSPTSRPKIPAAYRTSAVRPARQHPPGAPARGARAGREAEARRRRHDELLDRGRAEAALAEMLAKDRPARHQRRGGARSSRASTTSRRPRATSASAGPKRAHHQARRVRRAALRRRRRLLRARLPARGRGRSRPARATRSPAASSGYLARARRGRRRDAAPAMFFALGARLVLRRGHRPERLLDVDKKSFPRASTLSRASSTTAAPSVELDWGWLKKPAAIFLVARLRSAPAWRCSAR